MQLTGVALLVSQSDGTATLEVAGRAMFQLNPVAVIIWENLALGAPIQEIIGQLVDRFNIPEERAANDVTNFIGLLKQQLLVVDDRKRHPETSR